jgi:hypothetical protein
LVDLKLWSMQLIGSNRGAGKAICARRRSGPMFAIGHLPHAKAKADNRQFPH